MYQYRGKGRFATSNCIYKSRPQGQNGVDRVTLPQGLYLPDQPPWRSTMQVEPLPYRISLGAEESKLMELDRLLQKERDNMSRDPDDQVVGANPAWDNNNNKQYHIKGKLRADKPKSGLFQPEFS